MQIDTNLKLPLSERYFLGGLGEFQLRGFDARSVGPRRAILYERSARGSTCRWAGPRSIVLSGSTRTSRPTPTTPMPS